MCMGGALQAEAEVGVVPKCVQRQTPQGTEQGRGVGDHAQKKQKAGRVGPHMH